MVSSATKRKGKQNTDERLKPRVCFSTNLPTNRRISSFLDNPHLPSFAREYSHNKPTSKAECCAVDGEHGGHDWDTWPEPGDHVREQEEDGEVVARRQQETAKGTWEMAVKQTFVVTFVITVYDLRASGIVLVSIPWSLCLADLRPLN